MINSSVCGIIFLFCAVYAQRVAPGVPPQQYDQGSYQHNVIQHQAQMPSHQQQPMPTYQQQMPVHQQQMPVHQQQVPQHQQQVPQHQQQVPQHQQQQTVYQQQQHQQQEEQIAREHQNHHRQGHQQPVLNTGNLQDERHHIAEHMEVPIDTSKMTEQELQFHYFKMHDSDNNNKLDGCELIKSLIHWHEQGHKDQQQQHGQNEEKIFSDEELIALIDPILQMDDTSHDGFIDYPEFIKAQQKASAQTQRQPPQ